MTTQPVKPIVHEFQQQKHQVQQKLEEQRPRVKEVVAEKDVVVLPANWEKMSMKELIRLKINPQVNQNFKI